MEIGLLALGLAAGVLSGLFGIGGGIVMVPALIAIFGFDLLDANAISLAAMLLPVGILGVIAYYRAGYVDLKKSLLISLGLLAGSFFGAKIAMNIGEGLLAKLYAGLLLYVAVGYLDIPSLIKKKRINSETAIAPRGSVWALILLGIFAGVIAGMFGKGGGLIIVPALVTIFRFDSKTAAATSLTALQLPVGLPSGRHSFRRLRRNQNSHQNAKRPVQENLRGISLRRHGIFIVQILVGRKVYPSLPFCYTPFLWNKTRLIQPQTPLRQLLKKH